MIKVTRVQSTRFSLAACPHCFVILVALNPPIGVLLTKNDKRQNDFRIGVFAA
ncbi:MAG: hypothetical protein RR954_03890 [Christensenellaceae bacterium]